MTITVPWRRMTLQLSQRALTDALTFKRILDSCFSASGDRTRLLQAVGDATAGEVVGRELDPDAVSREDPDEVHPELPADVSKDAVAVLKLDCEHRVG